MAVSKEEMTTALIILSIVFAHVAAFIAGIIASVIGFLIGIGLAIESSNILDGRTVDYIIKY